jgi:hypothetical protein
VYLTSSSATVEVSTQTKLSSSSISGAAWSSTAGSNTTSPFIHSTPPACEDRSARSRLCEVLVTAKSGLKANSRSGWARMTALAR